MCIIKPGFALYSTVTILKGTQALLIVLTLDLQKIVVAWYVQSRQVETIQRWSPLSWRTAWKWILLSKFLRRFCLLWFWIPGWDPSPSTLHQRQHQPHTCLSTTHVFHTWCNLFHVPRHNSSPTLLTGSKVLARRNRFDVLTYQLLQRPKRSGALIHEWYLGSRWYLTDPIPHLRLQTFPIWNGWLPLFPVTSPKTGMFFLDSVKVNQVL